MDLGSHNADIGRDYLHVPYVLHERRGGLFDAMAYDRVFFGYTDI